MTVRLAQESDLETIALLHWRGWEETYRGLLSDHLLDGTTLEMRRGDWARWWPAKREGLFLAQAAGAPAGFVCAVPARDIAAQGAVSEIQLLYVLKERQGEGHGRRLLKAGADWAARACPGPLGLWVVTGNAPARRFYERLGGRLGAARRESLRGAAIDEVAYLWDDSGALARGL
jgi:GNAT superfamily N-acetyltransferase